MSMQSISQFPDQVSLWVQEVDDNGNLRVHVQGVTMPGSVQDYVIPEWLAPYLLPLSGSGIQTTAALMGKTLTLQKQ